MKYCAIIPVAGYGFFEAGIPKVATQIRGKSMIEHIVQKIKDMGLFDPIYMVINPKYGAMIQNILTDFPDLHYVVQPNRFGTADAVERVIDCIPQNGAKSVLIHFGDMPIIQEDTIQKLLERHSSGDHPDITMTLLPLVPGTDPAEFGRVIWQNNKILRTLEPYEIPPGTIIQADYVNPSLYVAKIDFLRTALPLVNPFDKKDGFQPERRLQDVIGLIGSQKICGSIAHVVHRDLDEFLGANTFEQFQRVSTEFMKRRFASRSANGMLPEEYALLSS